MDFHKRKRMRISAHWFRNPLKCFLTTVIIFGITTAFIKPATTKHAYPALNTPPILYVPDRNWRISEAEQVGQVIARIRAEDAENDELIFGLEPHFHANYANSNEGVGGSGSEVSSDKLPFYIDPVGGAVYLNESLLGRAGENFFLYITVSDGKFTAKNEVFVNILGKNHNKNAGSRPPSIQNMVQNISQFLPAFNQLPGVQFTNQQPGSLPSNSLPPGFGLNPPIFKPQHTASFPPVLNFNPDRKLPIWPTSKFDENIGNESDNETESSNISYTTTTTKTTETPKTTSRIKLTAISTNNDQKKINASTSNTTQAVPGRVGNSQADDFSMDSTTAYSIKATTIPVLIALCGLFVAAVVVLGYLFRKRLCAISKTLNKKSKEEMVKKSNQSNLSSNITDDSRNFISMQNWNGPMVYGNRYVPWERDQQLVPQNMTSTSVANGATPAGDASFTGVLSGTTVGNNAADSLGVLDNITTTTVNNNQSKYDRWEFPRHRLKFFNILGEGAFGQVWRCEATDIDGLEGVTMVAVKTLKESATQVEKNDLVSELQVMKSLEPHVNVVRLLGCCTDKDPLFVIIEYVNRGKLQTYLRNSRAERHYGNTHGKSNILTSGDLTSFMYQVAKGMDYLTSRGIIHRDLAARNILITDDHTCKVADFGFARDVISSKIYERKSEGKLPIRWMATESLYDNIFSVKSDIWSFGILMWEIVTLGSTPYPGISAADVMRKVRDGHRLEKPEHCRRELYNIMYYCWSQDANERPTFAELVQLLDKLLHTEMDYIELERFPDHNYYNILSLSGEKL